MAYEDLLTHMATLQQATVTRNLVSGDEVESWVTKEAGVHCLVTRIGGQAKLPLGLTDTVSHLVHVEYRTDITVGRWRMIVDGIEYRVVDVNDSGNRHHHVEVLVRRMNA